MYRIEITEVTETTTVRSQWLQQHARENDLAPQFAWTDGPKTVESTRRVLTQEVESLDLPAVIKAVNGIGKRKRTRKGKES